MQEIKPLKKIRLSQLHAKQDKKSNLVKRKPQKVLSQKMSEDHKKYLKEL